MHGGVGSRTAVNNLGCLLGLGAGAVLFGGLSSDASRRAVLVQVAALVHGLLEGVALPAEDIITVGSSAAVSSSYVSEWNLSR